MKFLSNNTAGAKHTAVALCTVVAAMTAAVETNAQTWTGTAPKDASSKTVYLYNVGAKKFLGKGGRWGTEANLNYEGVPFKLTYSSGTFTLQSLVKAEGTTSTTNGYMQIMDGTTSTSTHDEGNYFVDRPAASSFTATSKTTADSKTAYTLKTTTAGTSTTYYMLGTTDNAVGSATSLDDYDETYGQWMIVTEEERRNAFETAEAANAKPVNSTFLMYDFDFARNDNSVSYWKTGSNAGTDLSYNISDLNLPTCAYASTDNPIKKYTHTYTYKSGSTTKTTTITNIIDGDTWKKAMPTVTIKGTYSSSVYSYTSSEETTSLTSGYTYYVGNGYNNDTYNGNYDPLTKTTFADEGNRQATYGGNWTANIHGASGAVQQTLETANMVRAGYYRISCKAFTTASADGAKVCLWAASSDNGNGSADDQTSEKYAYTAIPAITEAPATYVAASQLLQSEGTAYDASVKVYVENTSDILKFGIYVDGAGADAWTCFDDFAIQYLGNPSRELVLDEDQTDGNYIKSQATPDTDELQTVKLYLHRTLNAGKWNSIVLPVDLTVGQVKSAFGDQVRISEFKGAYDETRKGTIIFEAINADRDNSDETAIKAGNLYLIKPTTAMPTGMAEVTVPTTDTKLTSYYTIVGVTYAKASQVENINYSQKVYGEKGKETYEGAEDAIQFVGTYVKLTDELIPVNSYVLNGNNVGGTAGVWYYRTKETASKGFRGWLQPVSSQSKGITYSLDGVEETVDGSSATSIDNVIDDSKEALTISGNIYTLGGQLVKANATSLDGLASGIYVVGGKKIVK